MLHTLPHLPFQIILSHLNFQDILNLRRVPLIRPYIIDYYKRESNQKEIIRMSFGELMITLLKDYNSFIMTFGDDLYLMGLESFYHTEEYKEIHRRCLNQLLPEEINTIKTGKSFDTIQERIEYILKIHCITDLYDDIDDMNLTNERHYELCRIVSNFHNKEYESHVLYIRNFMKKKLLNFSDTLRFMEFFMNHIYGYYEDVLPERIQDWATDQKSRIAFPLMLFFVDVHKKLKILENVFMFE